MKVRNAGWSNSRLPSASAAGSDICSQDFLIGKGRFCQEHEGTIFVKNWTRARFLEYKSANAKLDYRDAQGTRTKGVIVNECLTAMKQRGARFLEKAICDNDGTDIWQEVPEYRARQAVVGAFRNHKRNGKKRRKRQAIGAHCAPPIPSPAHHALLSPEYGKMPSLATAVPQCEAYRTVDELEVGAALILLSSNRTTRR